MPGPGAILGWGLFAVVVAVVTAVLTGTDLLRALALGGLGASAAVALWGAARWVNGPTRR